MQDMTDEALRLEAAFIRDRLAAIEAEQRRRAIAEMDAILGPERAERVRRATAKALNTPTAARRLFVVTPL